MPVGLHGTRLCHGTEPLAQRLTGSWVTAGGKDQVAPRGGGRGLSQRVTADLSGQTCNSGNTLRRRV